MPLDDNLPFACPAALNALLAGEARQSFGIADSVNFVSHALAEGAAGCRLFLPELEATPYH